MDSEILAKSPTSAWKNTMARLHEPHSPSTQTWDRSKSGYRDMSKSFTFFLVPVLLIIRAPAIVF
jgi:hypothetical protein